METDGGAGRTWSLETTKADRGVVEDHQIWLSSELPQALSLTPEDSFGLAPEE